MTKFIHKMLLLGVIAVLTFTACDKVINQNSLNDSLNLDNPIYSTTGGVPILCEIPAEYDSIGMIYSEYFTSISVALIRKGLEEPTDDEIIYETKEFFRGIDPDFDTTVFDAFDITAMIDGMDSLNLNQQKVVSKINNLLETANSTSEFMQQIPSMVALICTLPELEREPLFIYLATVKYGVLNVGLITSECTLYCLSAKKFWTRVCRIWAAVNLATAGAASANPLGASITAMCVAYGLITLT